MNHLAPFLPRELPSELNPLADLATDLRWTWSHASDALWKRVDPVTWEVTENPYVILQNLNQQRLDELAKDHVFKAQLESLALAREDYLSQASWFHERYGDSGIGGIAYFSMEFGVGEALPLYAGGLGILAGDYLKAASDLGVPVIGVGLLYQEGYFHQILNSEGWQQDIYPYNDPITLPVQPVEAREGAWLHVPVELPGRVVRLRVWQARVGRVTLYLLDSNDPLNSPVDRGITGKLYGGGKELRLMQEIVLGIGGWRLIEALGLSIDLCHLNEGHAAFVTLERARSFMERHSVDYWEALWATRAGNVFTTHTPVEAGFDTYDRLLMAKYGREYADSFGVNRNEIFQLGRAPNGRNYDTFNMAYLAMRTCGAANAVSRLHSDVSRRIFHELYPRWPRHDVPVSHVTNGVHVPSWDSPWADEVWTRACGKGRWMGALEPVTAAIGELSDEALWEFDARERSDLVHYARKRLVRHLSQRGADAIVVAQALNALDPNVLTLGFARRFAEYKRPNLLLHDVERLVRLLTNPERPVQIIVAGKAHPEDETGKRYIQEWAEFTRRPDVRAHAIFLEDYDIALAQELVQGVDVWLNTPRRPWEASGTSGMKVLVNGGLNLSVLDGWWAEAHDPDVGWALGNGLEHGPEQDVDDARELYRLLEQEVVPMFYDRDASGIPRAWVARMRASMARLAPQFSTNRMVREYMERLYLPAIGTYRKRCCDSGAAARSLRAWETTLRAHWQGVHWGNVTVSETSGQWQFQVQLYLGDIPPEFVQVQLYAEPLEDEVECATMRRGELIPGAINGYMYQCTVAASRPAEHFTPRVVPYHPEANVPAELALIGWRN